MVQVSNKVIYTLSNGTKFFDLRCHQSIFRMGFAANYEEKDTLYLEEFKGDSERTFFLQQHLLNHLNVAYWIPPQRHYAHCICATFKIYRNNFDTTMSTYGPGCQQQQRSINRCHWLLLMMRVSIFVTVLEHSPFFCDSLNSRSSRTMISKKY